MGLDWKEGINAVCVGCGALTMSLYKGLLGTFSLLLSHDRLPAAWQSGDSRARCLGLSLGTARLLQAVLSSLPFPANAESRPG